MGLSPSRNSILGFLSEVRQYAIEPRTITTPTSG